MCVICALRSNTNYTSSDDTGPNQPQNSPGGTNVTYVAEGGDVAGDISTTATMDVGDFFSGHLTAGDDDYIAINLVAGQTYTMAMVGIGTLGNSLADPYLRLYDSAGNLVDENDDGGPGRTSDLEITISTTGTYYISARDYYTANSGDYMVSVATGTRAEYEYQMGAGALTRDDASWSATPGTPVTITYGFMGTGTAQDASGNSTAFQQLTAAQQAAAVAGFSMFSDVSGLTFTNVNPGGTSENATIRLGAYTSTTDGAGAYAYFPGSTAASSNAGDIWLNNDSVSGSSLPAGSYSFFAMLHEMGHAMGLHHPGDYNAGPDENITYNQHAQFTQDSHQYTVMSYFDESNTTSSYGSYPDTLMMYDIYALHQLYGANMQTRAGDSVYGFNSNTGVVFDFTSNTVPVVCIWDADGIDTLDMSGYSQSQIINLTDGTFSSVGGMTDNLSIAIGAVIENAEGGSGNDTINGNSANNTIDGNGGNDTINGGAGNDRIIYDAADTAANVNGGDDIDTLVIIGGSAPTGYNLAAGSFEFAEHQETDTGGEFWASRASTYNASWQKTAETGIADNGNYWASEFDVANGFWYADVTQWFSAADQLQYTNYTHDNGNTVNQAWDFDSSQWWQYFTNYFDESMNLTNTDGVADDNRYWSASNDIDGSQWWSTYTLWYDVQDPNTRQLINEEGIADDGRTWTTTHDVNNIYTWSSQTNWFDTNGDLIETITV